MKKITFIILMLCLLSCRQKNSFYDIDGPVMEFYEFYNDKILFQFNEPVKKIILKNTDTELIINNNFYTANLYLSEIFFKDIKNTILNITAIDSFDNKNEFQINAPKINENPAILTFEEINLKYSKKTKQFIKIKSIRAGWTEGAYLVVFIRGDKLIIPFSNEYISNNNTSFIYIDAVEELNNFNNKINFNKNGNSIVLKNRLSLISSCIILYNYKNEIMDYFLYYNLKNHEKSYYENNKNFNKYKYEIINKNIIPQCMDISEISTKKTIKKINNQFTVDK